MSNRPTFNQKHLPQHLAIIMDGNARWSKKHGVQKIIGYKNGAKNTKSIVDLCNKYGISYLTLFAFSSENWNRPQNEVDQLMELMQGYLENHIQDIIQQNIRIIFIGDHSKLNGAIRKLINKITELSSHHSGMTLIIALSYGARNEIAKAAYETARYMLRYSEESQQSISEISEQKHSVMFESFLNQHSIPDPDLLIRTSGEKRISNFLLWEIAYTELYFSDKLWPDFNEEDLIIAFNDFANRTRRYGR